MGLATGEILCGTEVEEVFVVGEDNDRVWVPFEVVMPGFQGPDDGKEFSIIDLVILFCGIEGLGEISTRMAGAILICLEEDCSSSCERGIGCKGKLAGRIRVAEDGF